MRIKLSWTVKLWKKTWIFNFKLTSRLVPTPTEETAGMGSITSDGLHQVVFLDYDFIDLERLKRELTALQETYGLGNFYIFAMPDRENAYHAVCLDCLPFREAREIIMHSSCDASFKNAPHYSEYRDWVLRLFPKGERDKPEYVGVIESPYEGLRKQSRGHAMLLNKLYNLNIKLVNPDVSEEKAEFDIRFYHTASRVKKQ